jgi:hypothetical protein
MISGPRSVLRAPDPNSKTNRIVKPSASPAVRYWNMARQRYTARRSDVAAPCASLPTEPLAPAPTAAENPGFSTQSAEFARETDSLLEEAGFELSVPHRMATASRPFLPLARRFLFAGQAFFSTRNRGIQIRLPPGWRLARTCGGVPAGSSKTGRPGCGWG